MTFPFADVDLPRLLDRHLLWPAAAIFMLLLVVRRFAILRTLLSVALTTALLLVLLVTVRRQAAFDPALGRVAQAIGLDDQRVTGRETRLRAGADGHFWARATIDGVPRRMLIDSGATVTALSARTAAAAGIALDRAAMPVVLRTANGAATARTGRIRELRLGNVVARDLAVVVSPAFGDIDVIGMNFLSRLAGWRVADGLLILSPHHPMPIAADRPVLHPTRRSAIGP